jgi:hypothetical protein
MRSVDDVERVSETSTEENNVNIVKTTMKTTRNKVLLREDSPLCVILMPIMWDESAVGEMMHQEDILDIGTRGGKRGRKTTGAPFYPRTSVTFVAPDREI